jgi:hypothetical protein
VNKIPHSVRQNLAAQPPAGDHPDADQLTAFAEQRLATAERETVLAHLATCGDCREIIALAAPEAAPATAQPAFVPARSWWSVRSLQWGAAAAAMAIAAVAIGLLRPTKPQGGSVFSEVAQTKPAAPPPPKVAPKTSSEIDSANAFQTAPSQPSMPRNEAPTRAFARHPGNQPADAGIVGGTAYIAPSEDRMRNAGIAGKLKTPEQKQENSNTTERGVTLAKKRDEEAGPASASPASTVSVTSESAALADKNTPALDQKIAAAPQATSASTSPQANSNAQAANSAALHKTANRRVLQESAAQQAAPYNFKLEAVPGGSNAGWRINAGRLQRLDSERGSWNEISVGTASSLSVVGSVANEVWVGGANGTMFYSNDSGSHWVPVSTGSWDKSATIVGITPTARQSVEVHLSNGERWRSADAGASWNKYQ